MGIMCVIPMTSSLDGVHPSDSLGYAAIANAFLSTVAGAGTLGITAHGSIVPGHCTYWYSATQIADTGSVCVVGAPVQELDTFIGTNGTLLTAHISNKSHTWTDATAL
jgi:hypothetical protein